MFQTGWSNDKIDQERPSGLKTRKNQPTRKVKVKKEEIQAGGGVGGGGGTNLAIRAFGREAI